MYKILFVCTGNTCRSAMAEALAKHMLADYKDDYIIESRGIYAGSGKISANALNVLSRKYGLNAAEHMAKQLKKEDLDRFDIILTMTSGHKYYIFDNYNEYNDKVLTLKEYTYNKNEDISDPYGLSIKSYEKCAEEIENCLKKLIIILVGEKS